MKNHRFILLRSEGKYPHYLGAFAQTEAAMDQVNGRCPLVWEVVQPGSDDFLAFCGYGALAFSVIRAKAERESFVIVEVA